VLKKYVTELPITRPYFDARPESPLEAFEAETQRHPVFRLKEAAKQCARLLTPVTPWRTISPSCPVHSD